MRVVDVIKIGLVIVSSFSLGWFSHSIVSNAKQQPSRSLQPPVKKALIDHLAEPYFV